MPRGALSLDMRKLESDPTTVRANIACKNHRHWQGSSYNVQFVPLLILTCEFVSRNRRGCTTDVTHELRNFGVLVNDCAPTVDPRLVTAFGSCPPASHAHKAEQPNPCGTPLDCYGRHSHITCKAAGKRLTRAPRCPPLRTPRETVVQGARQDKTRQDKTRQDKTRQDKTRQDKTRQDKTRQDKTRQDKTRQDKTRQDKTRQDKTRQDKTRQDKTRHSFSRCGHCLRILPRISVACVEPQSRSKRTESSWLRAVKWGFAP